MSPHLLQNIEYVKGQLDMLLRQWKPHNLDLMKMRKIPSHPFRVCDILFASAWAVNS